MRFDFGFSDVLMDTNIDDAKLEVYKLVFTNLVNGYIFARTTPLTHEERV